MASLRLRFLASGALLVATAVVAAAWAAWRLDALATAADEAVVAIERTSSEYAAVTGALEREDDALLVALGDIQAGAMEIRRARGITDEALQTLAPPSEATVLAVQSALQEYRLAVDAMLTAPAPVDLTGYRSEANPRLRAVLLQLLRGRDERLAATRLAAQQIRDEVRESQRVVALVASTSFLIAAFVALRLARHVLRPIGQLAQAATAMRDGDFAARVDANTGDEIAGVGVAFNELAARLQEFHRSNLGEVMRAKATLEATMRALPDPVLLLGADGAVIAANPATHRLFAELQTPLPETAAALATALGGPLDQKPQGVAGLAAARRIVTPMATRHLLPRLLPLAEPEHGGGAVLVLSDVTLMVELDERRTELVAVASHELRTPLTTLRMSLSMLHEDSQQLPPRVRELVATAAVGVDLLGETVDELLDMARIEAGQLRLVVDRVDVAGLLQDAIERHLPRYAELGVALDLHVEAAATVLGDRARLRNVLDNLLDNAAKYAPRGSSVRIVLRLATGPRQRPSATIEVEDEGPGVPESLRERIFEKFFRVESLHSQPRERQRGAGIGLFLCRHIVQLHGGEIRCHGGAGGGALFRIWLPIAA